MTTTNASLVDRLPEDQKDYRSNRLVSITIQRLMAKPDLQLEIAVLKRELPEAVVRDAPGFPEASYLDLPGAGTQLHIAKDNGQHLMISILGFGEGLQVSGAAAQIARKAMRQF